MSRYLVTGATGFIGRHLVRVLSQAGHDVEVLCRKDPNPPLLGTRVKVHRGDVLDAQSVRAAAGGCDGLFHAAGRVSRDPDEGEAMHRLHVEGTQTVLDAARDAGIKRAVVVSTSGVVAVSESPDDIPDETAGPPMQIIGQWPYYRSKLYAELAALERNSDGFEVVVVNPTLVFGPGDLVGSSTEDIVDLLEERTPMLPPGGLSFVDARDVAEGLVLAMEKGEPGERYLMTAQNIPMADFAKRIGRIAGVAAPRVKLPRSVSAARVGADLLASVAKKVGGKPAVDRPTAEMMQYFWYANADKAQRELGWQPRDPNETLADTVDDLMERGVVWPRGARA